jgi:signal peptidase I
MAYQDEHEYDEHDDQPGTVKEIIVTIVAALVLAYGVQGYVIKPFRIPSGSMENTLRCTDRVLVDRVSYHFSKPQRKDVVVFHPPAQIGKSGKADTSVVAGDGVSVGRDKQGKRVQVAADVNYIKRIIGLPGDTVQVKHHHAFVNGKALDEPYLHPLPKDAAETSESEFGPYEVPANSYLMLGDHRDNSADGRVFGTVPRSFIIGKAFMVYWPLKRIGGLPKHDPGGPKASQQDPNCLESVGQGDNDGGDG